MTDDFERTWDGLPISKEKPYGTAIVVYRRRGNGYEYLVLHRKHEGPDYEGDWAWGSPSGSRLPGEPLEACVVRELYEETGLRLPVTLTDAGTEDWYVYCAEAPAGAEIRLSAEHDRFEWLPADEAAARSLPVLVGNQILHVARELRDPTSRHPAL